MLGVISAAVFLFAHAPTARAQCGSNASAPACPTPTPVNAFLSLDVTSGDPNTVINVTGGQFLPNEQMSLYWDSQTHVAGAATADNGGSFNTRVKPFAGDAPGLHRLYASVPPYPSATFTLVAPATSPSPSPTPSESPSPSTSPGTGPTDFPTSSPVAAPLNGISIITSPPLVFLPIVGGLAILLSLGYWFVSYLRRPRIAPLPSAAVVHRAIRPDYSAGFGAPPPPTPPAAEPSAWTESMPETHPPEPPAPGEPPAPAQPEAPSPEWGPPVEWGTGAGDWGFPEPPPSDESPEVPHPGD